MAHQAHLAEAALITVDWGTTCVRTRLVDARGATLAQLSSGEGIGQISDQHEEVFERLVVNWPTVPAIMAGMVGSRQGWCEVPYVACPVAIAELAPKIARMKTRRGRPIAIVPGLMVRRIDRDGDVLRGEESQIVGFVERNPQFVGVCIMPGTHSKWVSVSNGSILNFRTFLTGELFQLLSHHSILRHSVAGGGSDIADAPDFVLGVKRIGEQGRPFLSTIFSVRARQLLYDVNGQENRAYLAGLIIGGEIAAARVDESIAQCELNVIGTQTLAHTYARAFDILGKRVKMVDGDEMAVEGLVRLARDIGLMNERSES